MMRVSLMDLRGFYLIRHSCLDDRGIGPVWYLPAAHLRNGGRFGLPWTTSS